ncbi:MAG: hypothetical protein J7647_23110 [Cyanobacteria bacterium SBLK]|nr:hypothetical protein [Cyanobacteria bacterium SBLK]
MQERVNLYNALKLPTSINSAVLGIIDRSGNQFTSNGWLTFSLSPQCDLSDVQILELDMLLCTLKHGHQMRCHTPEYALVLNREWVASFCFQCNNIHVSGNGKRFGVEFDGMDDTAQALMKFFESSLSDKMR